MTPLRILVVHNRYQQYGGEDSVVDAETRLLETAGHAVERLIVDNDAITSPLGSAAAALLATYNPFSRRDLARVLAARRPSVVHVHNVFPRLSPSIFEACRDAGVPSVLTLHNFRIGCANGFLVRDGRPCELCLGGSTLPAIQYRCYRGSLAGSATLAAMIAFHRRVGTWSSKVDRLIALTDFSRGKLIEAGASAERTVVKPNFMFDPLDGIDGIGPETTPPVVPRGLYVGRLSAEKGVGLLVEAWRELETPLTIAGTGPLEATLKAAARGPVDFAGQRNRTQILGDFAAASYVVVPSVWYENFPMTVVEAMAMGKPVIASDIGALREIVHHGEDGLLFEPGNPAALRAAVRTLTETPGLMAEMGRRARARYLRELTPERNLTMLEAIYRGVIPAGAKALAGAGANAVLT